MFAKAISILWWKVRGPYRTMKWFKVACHVFISCFPSFSLKTMPIIHTAVLLTQLTSGCGFWIHFLFWGSFKCRWLLCKSNSTPVCCYWLFQQQIFWHVTSGMTEVWLMVLITESTYKHSSPCIVYICSLAYTCMTQSHHYWHQPHLCFPSNKKSNV